MVVESPAKVPSGAILGRLKAQPHQDDIESNEPLVSRPICEKAGAEQKVWTQKHCIVSSHINKFLKD
jgi:hypothetical protein